MTSDVVYAYQPSYWVEGLVVSACLDIGGVAAVWAARDIVRRRRIAERGGFGIALCLAALLVIAGTLYDATKRTGWSAPDRWQTVCGFVRDFETEQRSNTGYERFSVRGVEFAYADYGGGIGYHTSQGRGGVFGEGMRGRISYVQLGNRNAIVCAERLSDGTADCELQ